MSPGHSKGAPNLRGIFGKIATTGDKSFSLWGCPNASKAAGARKIESLSMKVLLHLLPLTLLWPALALMSSPPSDVPSSAPSEAVIQSAVPTISPTAKDTSPCNLSTCDSIPSILELHDEISARLVVGNVFQERTTDICLCPVEYSPSNNNCAATDAGNAIFVVAEEDLTIRCAGPCTFGCPGSGFVAEGGRLRLVGYPGTEEESLDVDFEPGPLTGPWMTLTGGDVTSRVLVAKQALVELQGVHFNE